MRERHVSELFAEVFRRGGMKRGMRRAEAVLLWRRLVGPELAAFSSATVLRDGVLYVNVSDSETAMHLSMERQRFIAAYRDRYGVGDVREIRFQTGRLQEEPAVSEPMPTLPAPEPDEVKRMELDIGGLHLPPEVEREALAVGHNLLALRSARRAHGWVPCPTCGALHDGPLRPVTQREAAVREAGRTDPAAELDRTLCQACARYAREGRVVAAVKALRSAPLTPTPLLSDDELAVARFLAARELDAMLADLLPAATLDRALGGALERVARLRLAIAAGRPPESFTSAELADLDPRIPKVIAHAAGPG